MSKLADAFVEVSLRNEKMLTGLAVTQSKLAASIDRMNSKAKVRLDLDTKGFDKKLSGVASKIAGVAGGILAASGISSLIDALKGVGSAALSTNADLEQSMISMEVLLGNQAQAAKLINDIRVMAAKTPFDIPGLTRATQALLGVGVAAGDALPMLSKLGDAAAGSTQGMEALPRIVRAVSQMISKGKITAGDMNQIAELGIPGWDALAKKMGKSTAEVQQLGRAGKLGMKEIQLLVDGLGEKFPDMMAKQSQSFRGLSSTLRDNVGMALQKISKPIFELAKVKLKGMVDFFDSPRAAAMIDGMAAGVQKLIDTLSAGAAVVATFNANTGGMAAELVAAGAATAALVVIIPQLVAGIKMVGLALRGLALNPVGAVIMLIGAAAFAVIHWRKEIAKFVAESAFLQTVAGYVQRVWTWIKQAGASLMAMLPSWDAIKAAGVSALEFIIAGLNKFWGAAVRVRDAIFNALVPVWAAIQSAAAGFWGWITGQIEANKGEWSQWGQFAEDIFQNYVDTTIALIDVVSGVFTAIVGIAKTALDWINEQWQNVFGQSLLESINGAIAHVFAFVTKTLDWISLLTTSWTLTWELIKTAAQLALVAIGDFFADKFNLMLATGSALWAGLVAGFSGIKDYLIAGFTEIGNVAKAVWAGIQAAWAAGLSGDPTEAFKKAFMDTLATQENAVVPDIGKNMSEASRDAFNRTRDASLGDSPEQKALRDEIDRITGDMKAARDAKRAARGEGSGAGGGTAPGGAKNELNLTPGKGVGGTGGSTLPTGGKTEAAPAKKQKAEFVGISELWKKIQLGLFGGSPELQELKKIAKNTAPLAKGAQGGGFQIGGKGGVGGQGLGGLGGGGGVGGGGAFGGDPFAVGGKPQKSLDEIARDAKAKNDDPFKVGGGGPQKSLKEIQEAEKAKKEAAKKAARNPRQVAYEEEMKRRRDAYVAEMQRRKDEMAKKRMKAGSKFEFKGPDSSVSDPRLGRMGAPSSGGPMKDPVAKAVADADKNQAERDEKLIKAVAESGKDRTARATA